MDLARCGRIGQLQDGLITRNQALQFLANKKIHTLIATGEWEALHAAVFRMAGAPDTWRQRARAVTMIRDDAVASHLTAARLWGVLEWPPAKIEVLVPYGRSARVPGVLVHRTRYWHADMLASRDGIPLTSPARTLIDITAVTGVKTLTHAVDLAITTGIVTLDDIAHELKLIGTQGRKRCSMLFEVLAAHDLVTAETKVITELQVLKWIRRAGLPDPVPQYPLPLRRHGFAYPDLAYPDLKIAIELQSWKWHGGPTAFEKDIQRKLEANQLGWAFIELSAKTGEHDAITAISRALDARR